MELPGVCEWVLVCSFSIHLPEGYHLVRGVCMWFGLFLLGHASVVDLGGCHGKIGR